MFDRDRFTQDCLEAIRETDSHIAVKELVERACRASRPRRAPTRFMCPTN